MMRLLYILTAIVLSASTVMAQDGKKKFPVWEKNGEVYGEMDMDAVVISAKMPSKAELRRGKRKLKKLTRLRWNVHKVYPYAVGVAEVMEEAYAELETITEPKARKEFLRSREDELFGEYEDDVRKMSRGQGKVLIKLIYRETGSSGYKLIKEMKSGASAVFWQGVGALFGINLKADYDPEEEQMIEDIVADLERGGYNIVYKKYNYTFTLNN